MAIAVVFLPGVIGSTLFDNGTQVWPAYDLIKNGTDSPLAAKFMDPSFPLNPKELVQDIVLLGKVRINGYTKTTKFFRENGFTILQKKTGWANPGSPSDKLFFEYPYDWRLDLRNTADLLHTFIQTKVLGFGANIDIYLVGFSMGGLLSRTYLKKHGVLPNIKKQILIATPNHGSPKLYGVLREGRGLIATAGPFKNFPKDLKVLAHDLPGIYQLLPDDQYGKYFGDYGPLVYAQTKPKEKPLPENSIPGTYIPEESTLYTPHSEENKKKAKRHYALDNDTLVRDALKFHNDELKNDPFLPGKTYAIYSTELKTISGLRFGPRRGRAGSFRFLLNGDETVAERSAYDLDGLVKTTNMIPDPTKPDPTFTRRFSELSHSEIQWKRIVLRCVLELIQ